MCSRIPSSSIISREKPTTEEEENEEEEEDEEEEEEECEDPLQLADDQEEDAEVTPSPTGPVLTASFFSSIYESTY